MPMSHALRRSRTAAATLAVLCAGWTSLPAQAQFGSLLNSIVQMQQQQQQQQQAKQAAAQAAQNAKPSKKWPASKPVPPEVQTAASDWAAQVPGAPADMRPLLERLYIEGERNATLNFERIGMAALAAGKLDMAERSFEAAVTRIEQIYADNPEAQKAKSLWTAEKIKDYKGEPYERAMAYFYRGLVYAARGDFQNARAMFKQADYQDTVAEAEQYAGDFGLMPYMAGWSSYCDGNAQLSKEFLQLAAKGDKAYEGASTDQPVLVLFETGRAPFKYGGGKFGEELRWQARPAAAVTAQSACVAAGSQCVADKFMVGADVGYQATTRGGRPIDAVLGGKASFKEGAQTVSTVAGAIGSVGLQTALATGNRDSANLGMFGMFAGLVAQGVAQSTQAQADIREWEQLPNTVWLATGSSKVESDRLLVSLQGTEGEAGASSPMAATRLVDTPRCQLYWGRAEAPLVTLSDAGPLEPGEHQRDPAFRQDLQTFFNN